MLVPILLLSISSNMDNFVVGISYGLKRVHIRFLANLVIALITFTGTVLSMLAGKTLLPVVPAHIAEMFGSLILILIGCFCVTKYFYSKIKRADTYYSAEDPKKYDKDNSGNIEIFEACTLGLALTINNIGIGIAASISGLSVVETSIVSFFISLMAIYTGNKIGNGWLSKFVGSYAEPISGLIIIILGIYQIIS